MQQINKIAFLVSYGVETIKTSVIKEDLVTEAVISFLVLIILFAIL